MCSQPQFIISSFIADNIAIIISGKPSRKTTVTGSFFSSSACDQPVFFINVEKWGSNRANIYLFKFNKENARKRCEVCSNLMIKTPERRHWRLSVLFIVNFEHISLFFSSISISYFEQVIVSWEGNRKIMYSTCSSEWLTQAI